jgi:hypothetical protein
MAVLSVLMPVFNERRTLETITARVLAAEIPIALELVIMDDGSNDGSSEIADRIAARDARVRVIHQTNKGKGAALRSAIREARGDYAVFQDADLEYDPDDFSALLEPLLQGRADAVYGSRFTKRGNRFHSPLQIVANRLLTATSNVLFGLALTDMETCYKMIRLPLLAALRLESDGFDIEPEITARLAQAGARIVEVPINYNGRTFSDGKKIGGRDGIAAVARIASLRFRR